MSVWPEAIENFLQLQDGVDFVIAQHPNDRGNAITRFMTFIGSPGNTQSKLAALNNLFRAMGGSLPAVTWIDADTIEIAAGCVAMFSGNNYVFKRNATALQIKLSTDLDTGSEAANTCYDVYLIGDGSDSQYTAKFVLAGNTPSGATYYKKIFKGIRNNNSSDIVKFTQCGDWVYFPEDGLAVSGTVGTSYSDFTCPVKGATIAKIHWEAGAAGSTQFIFRVKGSSADFCYFYSGDTNFQNASIIDMPLNSDGVYEYKTGSGSYPYGTMKVLAYYIGDLR